MAIINWDPFNEMRDIQDAMNRLFDDSMQKRGKRDLDYWEPAVDIIEIKDGYKILADMPGIKKEDIEISVSGDVLTLRGEKKLEKEEDHKNYYRKERVYGLFQKQMVLPQDAQASKIQANFKDGVLTIIIPKGETSKPKKIKIE
ncbi:MAG: Hsp20/alpha crystallin family protein [Spirochaetes bacterium]|nr:Hsp20/alpha crystallin family protein [Spirochaetota bacterium]